MSEENMKKEIKNTDPGERYWRQLDLIDHKVLKELPVHIIGCGGIGSATALYAAKMGTHNITLWDHDMFEVHNMPNQMCRIEDLGKNKAEAVAKIIEDFEGVEVEAVPEKFCTDEIDASEIEPNSIIIMAVDSMKARKEIWNIVKKSMASIVIDGRMGLTALNVYSVDPSNTFQVSKYEETLWNDDQVAEVPCTAKATIFTAGTIASIICGHLAKIVKEELIPCEIQMEVSDFYLKAIDHKGEVSMETTLMEKF